MSKAHDYCAVARLRHANLMVAARRLPHLFEFPEEESYMLEWWACDFQAWYYQPYRDRIAAQFKRQQAAWASTQQQMLEKKRSSSDPGRVSDQEAAPHLGEAVQQRVEVRSSANTDAEQDAQLAAGTQALSATRLTDATALPVSLRHEDNGHTAAARESSAAASQGAQATVALQEPATLASDVQQQADTRVHLPVGTAEPGDVTGVSEPGLDEEAAASVLGAPPGATAAKLMHDGTALSSAASSDQQGAQLLQGVQSDRTELIGVRADAGA